MPSDRPQPAARSVLVFGAGPNQVPIIRAARRLGLRTIAIDRNPRAPGRALADRFVRVDLEAHREIDRALAEERIEGVVARVTAPGALAAAQQIARARRLPGPEPALVRASTRKRALAATLDDPSLRSPERIARPTASDLAVGPLLVRPDLTMRGKAGITRVDRAERLQAAIDVAEACSANGRCDAARWLEGRDVSVLAQLDRGRAWSIAVWDEWVGYAADGRILGLGVGMPACVDRRDPRVCSALDSVATQFAESGGLVMLSLRLDPRGGTWLIEIHLGLGGDAIAEQLLPTALPGFDPFEALVIAQVGGRVAAPGTRPRPCAIVRAGDGSSWRPMTARTSRELRARVRLSVPHHVELPTGLLDEEVPARATRGANGPSSWSMGPAST